MIVARAVRARRGCEHCGDAVAHWQVDALHILCVVDGLGHGRDAQAAAQASMAYVEGHLTRPLTEIFAECDRAVTSTRGVAMGIARVDTDRGTLEYAAVGNTRAMLSTGRTRRYLISCPGIVGGGYRRLQAETLELAPAQRLFLYTDGLPRRLDHQDFQSRLASDPPQLLANELLTTLGNQRDDNALMIYQYEQRVSGVTTNQ